MPATDHTYDKELAEDGKSTVVSRLSTQLEPTRFVRT
jgi:hypothetical protein